MSKLISTYGRRKSVGYNRLAQSLFEAFMRQFFQKIRFSPWSIPLALLAACALAYGPLIPFLGYYQDDWHFVYYASTRGAEGLIELLDYDGRPGGAWVYILGFAALGFKPLNWHIAILALRWLTVTAIWGSLHQLWPQNARQTLSVALVFALYPFFTLQPLAVAYSIHWAGYLFYALSIFLMLKARRSGKWTFTLLALLAEAAHVTTTEYFVGLEFLRPVLLWIALESESALPVKQKIGKTLRLWLPYLLPLALFVAWRAFIYQSPMGRNVPELLFNLAKDPLGTASLLAQDAIPDLIVILVSSWYRVFGPEMADLGNPLNQRALALALLGGLGCWFYFRQLKPDEAEASEGAKWASQALGVGTVGLLAGLIPAYSVGYIIHLKIAPWNSRLSMAAILGAALLLVGLMELLIASRRAKHILLALLAGLSIGWHFRNANDFRLAWAEQKSFYEQWAWRAPAIAANTALIAGEEVLPLMGDYPTSFGLNSMYGARQDEKGRIPYWFFSISSNFNDRAEELKRSKALSDQRHSVTFAGNSRRSLFFSFDAEYGHCLWLFRPEYAAYKPLAEELSLGSHTAFKRIQQEPRTDFALMQTILGPGNTETWCYFYEKAELARQFKQWEKVAQLWSAGWRRITITRPLSARFYAACRSARRICGVTRTSCP